MTVSLFVRLFVCLFVSPACCGGASGVWGPSVIDFPLRRSKPLVTLRERFRDEERSVPVYVERFSDGLARRPRRNRGGGWWWPRRRCHLVLLLPPMPPPPRRRRWWWHRREYGGLGRSSRTRSPTFPGSAGVSPLLQGGAAHPVRQRWFAVARAAALAGGLSPRPAIGRADPSVGYAPLVARDGA